MRFVAAVLLAVTVVGGARAIHPPMEPPPVISTTGGGGGGTPVQVTVVPTETSPEPSGVMLAMIGLLGGGTYRLVRRKR